MARDSENLKNRFLVQSLDKNVDAHDKWERDVLVKEAKKFLQGFSDKKYVSSSPNDSSKKQSLKI